MIPMADKKTSIFACYQILKEYSDENHPLTTKEILDKMELLYMLTIDRRTLYANIQMLQDFGFEISGFQENKTGYYLAEREFEEAEIMLLCNVIHSSNFIPSKNSKDLIEKLLSTQSRYTAKRYRDSVYIENIRKKNNKEFFWNLQILMEAIEEKVCIEFDYMHYNLKKELINKRKEKYVLHPYYLVYSNEKTYLIAKNEKYPDFSHYRIDKIRNLRKLAQPSMKLIHCEDPYQYAKNKIYMYGGKEISVVLRCHTKILDDILDQFGKEIPLIAEGEDYFVTRIKASRQGCVYLALQYAQYMEVIEPTELRQEICELLKNTLASYEK